MVALLALAGCPPQGDITPQIHVSPGAERRLCVLERRCPQNGAANGAAGGKARVHVMKAGEQLGGPNAIGRPGDLLLENDEVAFVIDQLGSSAGFADSGGNIVDAADAKTRVDEMGELFTFFGTFPRQAVYEQLSSEIMPDGSARVVARGKELYESELATETEYRLGPTDRALLMKTTLTNKSSHVIEGLGLGDAMQWGGAEKFAKGKPPGFKGTFQAPFVGAVGERASYALTSTTGEIGGISGSTWTDTIQVDKVSLAPGKSISYERVLIVGPRGDSAGLLTELMRASGEEAGTLTIRLQDAAGKPVPMPAGARFSVAAPGISAELMSIVAPEASSELVVDVPKGTFDLAFIEGAGRRAVSMPLRVSTVKGDATVVVTVSGTHQTTRNCVDQATQRSMPCVFLFEGKEGAPPPTLGGAHLLSWRNHVLVPGPTPVYHGFGKFRVTAFRGTEYEPVVTEEEYADGSEARAPGPTSLKRVQDTSGYFASDLHQHSMVGADAPVSALARVLSNAAYGVEVAVSSEHNVVNDFRKLIAEQRLEGLTASVPGNEMTSDASRIPWGHANAFPLVPTGGGRGGAQLVRDRLASEIFAELRALPELPIIQVNHPRAGHTGYFDALKFDPKTGKGSMPGYDDRFDTLEVWNGPNPDLRDRVIEDFFALLRVGYVITPTADTDSHLIYGQEPGFPRTFVRVSDDTLPFDAAKQADWVKGLRERRDVVLTNGPFLRMKVGGPSGVEGSGSLVRAKGGTVKLDVHVECTEWAQASSLEVKFAKAPSVKRSFVLTKDPLRGAYVANVPLTLRPREDDAFVVIVRGTKPLGPLLGPETSDMLPYAMTGATWVDVNGDGVALGRKTAAASK